MKTFSARRFKQLNHLTRWGKLMQSWTRFSCYSNSVNRKHATGTPAATKSRFDGVMPRLKTVRATKDCALRTSLCCSKSSDLPDVLSRETKTQIKPKGLFLE